MGLCSRGFDWDGCGRCGGAGAGAGRRRSGLRLVVWHGCLGVPHWEMEIHQPRLGLVGMRCCEHGTGVFMFVTEFDGLSHGIAFDGSNVIYIALFSEFICLAFNLS